VKNFVVVFLMTLLAACGRPGSQYLGRWQSEDGKRTVEISENGENFLLKVTQPAYKGTFISQPGDTTTTTIAGTVKDGILKIDGAFGGSTLTYVKADDTLINQGAMGGQTTYKRVK